MPLAGLAYVSSLTGLPVPTLYLLHLRSTVTRHPCTRALITLSYSYVLLLRFPYACVCVYCFSALPYDLFSHAIFLCIKCAAVFLPFLDGARLYCFLCPLIYPSLTLPISAHNSSELAIVPLLTVPCWCLLDASNMHNLSHLHRACSASTSTSFHNPLQNKIRNNHRAV
jgi:hypothetical protein